MTQTSPAPEPRQPALVKPAVTCAFPPRNGAILYGAVDLKEQGHVLQIKNGAGAHAIIKVRDASSRRLLYSFFVSDGATGSVEGIPDGVYIIQYAFGDSLDRSCRKFVEIEDAAEFPDREYFHTEYTETEVVSQVLTYTLYPVASGNVMPTRLNPSAFDAP